jgi:hypothetical protein
MTNANLPSAFLFCCLAGASIAPGAVPTYRSDSYAVGLSPTRPAFSWLVLDSLGQGRLPSNPVLAPTEATAVPGLELRDGFTYVLNGRPVWRLTCTEKRFVLRSEYAPGESAPPFALTIDQKANHATLLGRMAPGERRMELPCVLHLPDMGSVRITGSAPGVKLDYEARRRVKPAFVQALFPSATADRPVIEYRFEVVALYPRLAGIDQNPRYDGFRRNYLSLFQVNPRVQMLANNAASDPVAFSIFTYAEMAPHAPPLADGLTCLDLLRMTLDRYLVGAKGYGQIGYGVDPPIEADIAGWRTPWNSLDTLPSFLIAACLYVESNGDLAWARTNYPKLVAWGREMMEADRDGNGLTEYPGTGNFGDRPRNDKRPSNWWDTINFGHEDAYANALVYRACRLMAALAGRLARADEAEFFAGKAAKLGRAYAPTFLNPATGVLAGWKSADGQLHDYWFTFVQGVAISAGLLDAPTANAVMDRLLLKMKEVGFTKFEYGLPGNLVPIKKGDYVDSKTKSGRFGEPQRDDGSDGFQIYENGGATGCWAYYTIKALYQLGRVEDARRILYPMLGSYATGEFHGFGANGMSRDWRDWQGGCHGYEGLLVENYHALLAVLDDCAVPR